MDSTGVSGSPPKRGEPPNDPRNPSSRKRSLSWCHSWKQLILFVPPSSRMVFQVRMFSASELKSLELRVTPLLASSPFRFQLLKPPFHPCSPLQRRRWRPGYTRPRVDGRSVSVRCRLRGGHPGSFASDASTWRSRRGGRFRGEQPWGFRRKNKAPGIQSYLVRRYDWTLQTYITVSPITF